MKKLLLITTALAAGFAGPAHAGPVAAAVAWVGSTIAAGGLAGAALQFLGGLALNAIIGTLYKPKLPGADVSLQVKMGDSLPLSFTVGRFATAGNRKYIGNWGDNTRFITEVIEYSALPQGLAGIWVNDERGNIRLDDGMETLGGIANVGYRLTNYNRDGATRIWVRWLDGTQVAADETLIALFGNDPDYPWTAKHIGRGKSYAIITSLYDDETLTQYPDFLLEPEPLPFYDWRYDSTNGGDGPQRWGNRATYEPTLNPAVISYNIARGVYYGTEWVYGGKNLPAWRLPIAEWTAAANACDQSVTLAGGGTEPRYRCGLEISVDMEPASVLDEIGKSANMKFAEVGGRLKPIVDLPGASVFSFTDGDIQISEGQSFSPFYPAVDTFNAISATYPEPGEKWGTKDAPEFVDAAARNQDGGKELPTTMSYGAVPFGRQVQRLMRSQMRDFRRMRRHQFHLPPDAYALEPGIDMVTWTSERNGYINKQFMVESVQKTPGMKVMVNLREVDPSDYDWSSNFERPIIITPPVNPRPFVQPIRGLTVTGTSIQDAEGTARRPAILVACSGDETGVSEIQIEARRAGTDVASIDTLRRFSAPYAWYLQNVLRLTTYEVRARLLSDLTPRSAWSQWLTVTTPNVGFSWDDWDEDLREEIEGQLALIPAAVEAAADARERADQVRSDLDAAVVGLIENIDDARGEIAGEAAALRGEAATTRQQLEADIAAAETLALDNLNIARNYTDTSLQTESVARVSGDEALAAQIRTLTAVLNSENYLENSRFSDGLTGWAGYAAAATSVVAQDDASSDPVIADAPTANFLQMLSSPSGWRNIRQDFPVEFTTGEVFQWRVQVAASDAERAAQVLVYWYTDAGAQIGGPVLTSISPTANVWRIFSGQHTPPADAVSVRFLLRVAASASTLPVSFADASFTKVDQSVIARITDLEVVVANNQEAAASFQTDALARFGQNEAAISNEASARSTADEALAGQISTVSAVANRQRTFRQSTAPANPGLGDVWYDTGNGNIPRFWNGSAWVATDDARIAQTAAAVVTEATARADADAALSSQITTVSAQATRTRTFRQSGAPANPQTGDIWYRTDQGNRAYRYSGTAWQETDDTRLAENAAAITAEATARSTADGALANQVSTVSATANSKNRTFRQNTAPTGAGVGDLWFDSANGNIARRWSGSEWVATDDTRIAGVAAAITTEATARATADSALSQQITTVSSDVEDVRSAVTSEALARSTADAALVATTNTLAARATSIAGRIFPSDVRNQAEFWTQTLSGSPEAVGGVSAPPILFSTDPAVGSYIRIPAGHPTNLHVVSKAVTEYTPGRVIRLSVRCRAVGGTITRLRALFAVMDANWANTRNLNTATVISPTVGSTWQVVTVDYRLPAAQAGEVWLRIGVFSNAGDGPNRHVDIASIRIDDITAVDELGGDLTGEINEVKGLDLNALAGTALGVLLQQLRVNAGGTSATVTAQGSALATLEGAARAGYLLRAQAGGSVSLLDLIAADGSGGRPTSIARLAADEILLEGSVYADQLAVVGVPTLVHDPLYKRLGSWTFPLNATLGTRAAASQGGGVAFWGGENILRIIPASAAQYARIISRRVAVSPGQRVKVEVPAWTSGPGRGAVVRIAFFEAETGPAFSYPQAAPVSNARQIARLEADVPANAAYMGLELGSPPGTSTDEVWYGFPQLRIMDAANLIVSGGIVADMITAATMRALNGMFSSLAAANVRIGNAEVGTLQLAGNSVIVPVGARGAVFREGGINTWRVLLAINVPMPERAPISINWAIKHTYYEGGFGSYGLRIELNGTVIEQKDENRWPNDFPSGNAFGMGNAGNNTIRLLWRGWDATRIDAQGSLVAMGIMR